MFRFHAVQHDANKCKHWKGKFLILVLALGLILAFRQFSRKISIYMPTLALASLVKTRLKATIVSFVIQPVIKKLISTVR